MPIDNEKRRRAAGGIRVPKPDGTIDADDRRTSAGIPPAPVAVAQPSLPGVLEAAMAEMFDPTSLNDGAEEFCAEMFGHVSDFEAP